MHVDLIARPIDVWPGELTPDHQRQHSRFSASWTNTVRMLKSEAGQLGAREVVLQLAITERELRRDDWIRADARPQHPGVIVSMDTKAGPLRFSTDRHRGHGSYGYLPGWQANIRAVALGLEALRKVDRYGIGTGREQYAGWSALPPGRPMGASTLTVEEAARLLCDATADTIGEDPSQLDRVSSVARSLWREASKRHHPDAGGDPDQFRRLTEARDVLLQHR